MELAMWQIPRSTERIASYFLILLILLLNYYYYHCRRTNACFQTAAACETRLRSIVIGRWKCSVWRLLRRPEKLERKRKYVRVLFT